jgi:hypothetical protein
MPVKRGKLSARSFGKERDLPSPGMRALGKRLSLDPPHFSAMAMHSPADCLLPSRRRKNGRMPRHRPSARTTTLG